MSNVYLIGMMGSGKTVTGRQLASLLHYGFVDVDEMIQEKTRRAIAEIFEKKGEAYFRREEAEAIKEAAGVGLRVVATGGGSILVSENVERMRATGKIVYLEASLEVLWQRVRAKKDRPLLRQTDPRESLARIFKDRKALYEKAADLRVLTDDRSATAVAREIFELLGLPAARPGKK